MLHKSGLARKTSVPTYKPATSAKGKKTKLATYRMADGHSIKQISAQRFRTMNGTKEGGIICFSSKSRAAKFMEICAAFDARSQHSSSGEALLWLDPECVMRDPVFVGNNLPMFLRVLGNIQVNECTFHAGATGVTLMCSERRSYMGSVKLFKCSFTQNCLLSVNDLTTYTNLTLNQSNVYLHARSISATEFDGVEIHVPEGARLHNAIVNDHSLPMFFMHVGDDDGVLSAFWDRHGELRLARGCFHGNIKQFRELLAEKPKNSFWRKHYPSLLRVIEAKFKRKKA